MSSASASLVLILHIPLILEDYLPEDSPFVTGLVQLAQITQLILSPVLRAEALGYLEELVAKHHETFVKCYGERAVFPKLHMLLHIVAQIKTHGPGRHHWAMRTEAKNAIAKAKKLFNFKNVPFSISDFLQTNMSHALWHDNGTPKIDYGKTELPPVPGTPHMLSQAFCNAGLPLCHVGKTGLSMPKIVIKNVVLRTGDILLIGNGPEQPCFCKLRDIVCFEGHVFFKCQLGSSIAFRAKINSFVQSDTVHETVFTPERLLLPWPAYSYSKDNYLLCIPPCMYTALHLIVV